ncbi:MAG: hypothetical protein Q4D71_10885, partial [Oscillospiraceae bacterium]|nr:hypothetical protein [Oscillospiraceae bacterium]
IMQKTYQSTLQVETKPSDVLEDSRNLIKKQEYQKAFDMIEDDNSFEALMLKADIKLALKDYADAVRFLDDALKLNDDSDALLKKADALYRWAKVAYFPDCNYNLALDLINRALEIAGDSEDALEYWFLKGEIYQSEEMHIDARRCFLKAENRLEELEMLESELDLFEAHRDDLLINVTGVSFYRGLEPFTPGTLLDLVIDAENEHDPDAVACFLDGEIVGYVANSEYTLINDVKSASDIKSRIRDGSKAEVLFIFQHEFVIARIIV